jgi:hypothetical protein
VDGLNNLFYQVKAPVAAGENIPHQIKLRGEWSLTDRHKLKFTLDKWGRQTLGDQLTLEGEITAADENSLLFAVTTTSKNNVKTIYALELSGVWKADESNRLSFRVRRNAGKDNALTFNGAWELGRNNKLVYRYLSSDLITKKRRVHAIEFNGYWDIKNKYRISYLLGADTESAFDFKAGAGIYGPGYIKYELGIGLSGRVRPVKRTIALFGRWFVKEDTGIIFEMKYADKKTRAIVFGADAKLTGKDTVALRLRSGTDDSALGVTLELSRKIFKSEGEAFLEALASKRELAIYAGAAWRW